MIEGRMVKRMVRERPALKDGASLPKSPVNRAEKSGGDLSILECGDSFAALSFCLPRATLQANTERKSCEESPHSRIDRSPRETFTHQGSPVDRALGESSP